MIRVLLVDDHDVFRTALTFMLEREGDLSVVGQAGSLAEGRSVLSTTSADVALIDLDLPDGYGLDLVPALRERSPDGAAIVLSASRRPESPALAVASGAVGFLHKGMKAAQVVAAIRRAAAGETLFTPDEASALMRQAVQYQNQTKTTQQAIDQLTRRERDVLRALAAGLDNQAIADRLYLSTATVRTHIVQILRKLDVDSRLQAALLAVRYGMVDHDNLA